MLILNLTFNGKLSAQRFKSSDQVKAYFYQLDDSFNISMVSKDSLFFVRVLSDNFINCTPIGEINNKKEEIGTLLHLPLTKVESVASQFDLFIYSEAIATLSIIKKLTWKDGHIGNVRRTIVHQLKNGKWEIVSGQGTNVLPKYVEGTIKI